MNLDDRITQLEKRMTELESQLQERPEESIEEIANKLFTLTSSKVRNIGITG